MIELYAEKLSDCFKLFLSTCFITNFSLNRIYITDNLLDCLLNLILILISLSILLLLKEGHVAQITSLSHFVLTYLIFQIISVHFILLNNHNNTGWAKSQFTYVGPYSTAVFYI